ncbi:MAG TPA: hypothetical protein DG753_07095 [Clostridium sp.]|nr:hypothetical protein [Clostridium sp.]
MNKKKTGSTLITTIIMIMMVGTVGSAMLSMINSEYKIRISDSEKLKNLYSADSGLDVAYDILAADFDMAGNFASFKVEQMKNLKLSHSNENQIKYINLIEKEEEIRKNESLSSAELEKQIKENQSKKDKVINSEFKRNFKLYLFGNEYSDVFEEYCPNQLKYSIENGEYAVKINKGGTPEGNDLDPKKDEITAADFYINKVSLANNPDISVEYSVKNKDNDKSLEMDENYKRRQTFIIKITSKFSTINQDSETNQKQVQSIYNLIIPNYNDLLFSKQEYSGYEYAAYKDKGITVFGNMQVRDMGNSSLDIIGDVFVQGDKNLLKSNGQAIINSSERKQFNANDDISTTHITEKYYGGISLEASNGTNTKISFDGNLITRNTFNLSDNVEVNISKDLYAGNVYVGKTDGKKGNNSYLMMGTDDESSDTNMILNNDFTLKAINNNNKNIPGIKIDNFYGINDKNVSNNIRNEAKEQISSSIIVNTLQDPEKDAIKICKEAYIMGVAFVDTSDSYETGESVAIRGNYRAYSDGKNINDKNINEFDGDIESKSNKFHDYWQENLSKLRNGGIVFCIPENIHSVGAVVNRNELKPQKSNYTIDDMDGVIAEKKRDYAVNVYNFGESLNDASKEMALYNNPPTTQELKDKTFAIENIDESEISIEHGEYKGIFNKDVSKDIIIKGIDSSNHTAGSNEIVVDTDNKGNISAFIATSGNVIIDGRVNFSGNIIAGGNLIVKGNGDKTIRYNPKVAEMLQEENPRVFAKVFKLSSSLKDEVSPDESAIVIDYDLSKFLKQSLWQLKKNTASK